MSFDETPAMLEFSLSRDRAQTLLRKLAGQYRVQVNIRRARVTASDVWMQIELSGAEDQVRRALDAVGSAQTELVLKA